MGQKPLSVNQFPPVDDMRLLGRGIFGGTLIKFANLTRPRNGGTCLRRHYLCCMEGLINL